MQHPIHVTADDEGKGQRAIGLAHVCARQLPLVPVTAGNEQLYGVTVEAKSRLARPRSFPIDIGVPSH